MQQDNNVLFARQYMLIRAVKLPIIPNNNETAERKSNMWIGLTFDDLNNDLNFIFQTRRSYFPSYKQCINFCTFATII